jgi:hypothetical protein
MATKRAAGLDARLLVRKGAAAPPTERPSAPAPRPLRSAEQQERVGWYGPGSKALTLRLDKARYRALRDHCLDVDRNAQAVLIEALDRYLSEVTAE